MSHPNLFQVFHPICGVRASPLSYPTTARDNRSSKPGLLRIELRNFMARDGEGSVGPRLRSRSWFYVRPVTVEDGPRATRWLTQGPWQLQRKKSGDRIWDGAGNPFKRKIQSCTLRRPMPGRTSGSDVHA